ncbi:unnamed protein product [Caenorhabditis brenneri]
MNIFPLQPRKGNDQIQRIKAAIGDKWKVDHRLSKKTWKVPELSFKLTVEQSSCHHQFYSEMSVQLLLDNSNQLV